MQRTLASATDLEYSTADNKMIRMQAKFLELDFSVPFDACLTFPDAHQRNAYTRAVAGEFGPVAPYKPITMKGFKLDENGKPVKGEETDTLIRHAYLGENNQLRFEYKAA